MTENSAVSFSCVGSHFLFIYFFKDFNSRLQTLVVSEDNINAEFHLNVLAGQRRDKKGITAPSLSRKGLNVVKMVVSSVKMTQNASKISCSRFNMLADLLVM